MAHKPKQKRFLERNLHLIVIAAVALVVIGVYLAKADGNSASSAQAIAANVPAESDPAETPSGGTVAPNFKLTSTDGKTIDLSSFRGKVVIVDFWATWCPPCKAEIPDFIKLYSKYKDNGFQMLGISLDQNGLQAVVPFMKKYGINYPIMLGNEQVVDEYGGIRGIPTTFVIDKQGNIAASFMGYRPASVFENLIQKLTKEK